MIIQKWIHILLQIIRWLNVLVVIGIFIIKTMLNLLQKRKERILCLHK
nr:MAG TPA: ATP synthase [Caudoviricetes sp.]